VVPKVKKNLCLYGQTTPYYTRKKISSGKSGLKGDLMFIKSTIIALMIGLVFYWLNTRIVTKWFSIEKIYWENEMVKTLTAFLYILPSAFYFHLSNIPLRSILLNANPNAKREYMAIVFGSFLVTMDICLMHIYRTKKKYKLTRGD